MTRLHLIVEEARLLARDSILLDPTDADITDAVAEITGYRLTPWEARQAVSTYNTYERIHRRDDP